MVRAKPAFAPLFDYLLVTVEEAQAKEGELYVPDVAKEKPYHGTVLRTGPDTKHVSVGDRILFTKYSGKPIEIGGEKFQYMKETEVIGIFENE